MKQLLSILAFMLTSLFLRLNSTGPDYKTRLYYADIWSLDGYTMIRCIPAEGEFTGEAGDIVELINGMKFELISSQYNYSFGPDVGVFVKSLPLQGKEYLSYKLLIEDEIYGASRIK
jgi:hypothetical protein